MLPEPQASASLFCGVLASRRQLMKAIRSSETRPKRKVRSMLHGPDYRLRENMKTPLGKPDVALKARQKAVLVHGCFWYAHPNYPSAVVPKTRIDCWSGKLTRIATRDRSKVAQLKAAIWDAATVWRCELADAASVASRLTEFLGNPRLHGRRNAREEA
jgi:DNA mismatch endonuclease (patch repair protein)